MNLGPRHSTRSGGRPACVTLDHPALKHPASALSSLRPTPRFVTGSLLRHVFVMAGTSAVGLVAVFAVDLINLLYISLLGDKALTAAVGFAGVLSFFHTSISIGLMIGITATVARTVGAGRMADARRLASHSLIAMAVIGTALTLATLLGLAPLLALLGARDEAAVQAQRFLSISLLGLPLAGLGMASSALLRSVGDARRAMTVQLSAAAVTTVLDPLFIFVFGLGLDGAALVSLIARAALAAAGLHGAWRVKRLLGRPDRTHWRADAALVAKVAGPAVLTNLATPVGNAFVTHSMAVFGAAAMAGQATIDRVTPVAFGLIYALSGAVGPILAQNLGAGQHGRVREALSASMLFMVAAVSASWALLFALQGLLVRGFSLDGVSAQMLHAFCNGLCASFFFAGALFVANASFNNLGRPLWSTAFNWGRATLGTIPFVWWGAHYGPLGVMVGQAAGVVLFGSLAIFTAFALARRIGKGDIGPAGLKETKGRSRVSLPPRGA